MYRSEVRGQKYPSKPKANVIFFVAVVSVNTTTAIKWPYIKRHISIGPLQQDPEGEVNGCQVEFISPVCHLVPEGNFDPQLHQVVHKDTFINHIQTKLTQYVE